MNIFDYRLIRSNWFWPLMKFILMLFLIIWIFNGVLTLKLVVIRQEAKVELQLMYVRINHFNRIQFEIFMNFFTIYVCTLKKIRLVLMLVMELKAMNTNHILKRQF